MSGFNDTGKITLAAEGTIGKYELVKLGTAARSCVQAGDSDVVVGVAMESVVSGDSVPVHLLNKQGTLFIKVSVAISVGGIVYSGASGKGDATAGSGRPLGLALEASAADGDIIEVAPALNIA